MAPPAAISTAPIPANRPASLPPPVLASEVPLGEGEADASTEVDAEADAEVLGLTLLDAEAEGVVGTTTGAELLGAALVGGVVVGGAVVGGAVVGGAVVGGAVVGGAVVGGVLGVEQSPPGTGMVLSRWRLKSRPLAWAFRLQWPEVSQGTTTVVVS